MIPGEFCFSSQEKPYWKLQLWLVGKWREEFMCFWLLDLFA